MTANAVVTKTATPAVHPARPGTSTAANSAATIETAAVVPQVEIQSLHPTRKPAYSPNAYRENTYWPPERGSIAPSSAI